ncbi:MAG: glycosyltransferase [Bacteroidales bacterium]|jgi:glycosyltransferase involved in cell wall biosynthesis|nr:glycosyltransferase [Bacteroidales bacterium]
MTQSLISIITPLYNNEQFIAQTIESVLKQTYTNWELIITDDCSTDHSYEIAFSYSYDPRIKIFRLEKNMNYPYAKDFSLQKAKGKYITFLDSDDIWKENMLENQIQFMQANNYSFIYARAETINVNGNVTGILKGKKRVGYLSTLFCNYIESSNAMYDRDKVGYISVQNIERADWALWLLILRKVKYCYCNPLVVSQYRIHEKSMSHKKMRLFKQQFLVYNQFLGYNSLKSFLILFFIFLPLIIIKKIKIKIDSVTY